MAAVVGYGVIFSRDEFEAMYEDETLRDFLEGHDISTFENGDSVFIVLDNYRVIGTELVTNLISLLEIGSEDFEEFSELVGEEPQLLAFSLLPIFGSED